MEDGMCPGCRLAVKISAASAARQPLPGKVPNYGRAQQAQAPEPPPQYQYDAPQQPAYRRTASVATLNDSVESRTLAALSYPLPPVALLALLDRKSSPALRREVYQSLAFTGGTAAFGFILTMIAGIPILGISAWLLLGFLVPVWLVLSNVYGIKTYSGEENHIPIVSDWVDEKLPIRH